MLLACDVGNSYISFGLFKEQSLISAFSIATNKQATPQDYLNSIKSNIKDRLQISKLVIASVVPEVTDNLAKALKLMLEIDPKVLTNKDIPVENKYSEPDKVGVDRLLNAYAGVKLFKPPLIIIDFGTATTFDVVSYEGAYVGGAILPGVETSLEALFGKASKLSEVPLNKPHQIIGHNTEESIASGVVIGTAGLVDKMVKEIEKDQGQCAKIATGGLAALIIPYSESVEIIEPHLTLKAISLLTNS